MNREVVKITIKKDGSFSLEAMEGIKGQNCREKTKNLELILGGEAVSSETKSTYYEDDGDNGISLNLNI